MHAHTYLFTSQCHNDLVLSVAPKMRDILKFIYGLELKTINIYSHKIVLLFSNY